jgi:hypothetical protein
MEETPSSVYIYIYAAEVYRLQIWNDVFLCVCAANQSHRYHQSLIHLSSLIHPFVPPLYHTYLSFIHSLLVATMGKRRSRTSWVEAKKKGAEKERINREEAVYRSVVEDGEICALLKNARTHQDHQELGKRIKDRWAGELTASPAAIVGNLLSWAGRRDIRPSLEGISSIGEILDQRKQIQTNYRSAKRRLIQLGHLNPNTFDKLTFYSLVPNHSCIRLPKDKPYPPFGIYAAETTEITQRNHEFVNERVLPDRRKSRKLICNLWSGDVGSFRFDLDPGQSGVFRDADTNELVMVVIRNACGDQRIIDFLDRTIQKVIETRTNIRVSTIL